MPSDQGKRYDFFLSRRGSVAAIAREVTDVLMEAGYSINVEDYDFRPNRKPAPCISLGSEQPRCALQEIFSRRLCRLRACKRAQFTNSSPTD